MKIRILKDIPGYKTGSIIDLKILQYSFEVGAMGMSAVSLIHGGWAEEVKEEIDIENIRSDKSMFAFNTAYGTRLNISNEEILWFTAYRIVKAVIEKLNGDIDMMDRYCAIDIKYIYSNKKFELDYVYAGTSSILPRIANLSIGKKVIEFCKPELEILFNINN